MKDIQHTTPCVDFEFLKLQTTLFGICNGKYVKDGEYFEIMHGGHAYKFRKENKYYVDDGKNRVTGWEIMMDKIKS